MKQSVTPTLLKETQAVSLVEGDVSEGSKAKKGSSAQTGGTSSEHAPEDQISEITQLTPLIEHDSDSDNSNDPKLKRLSGQ